MLQDHWYPLARSRELPPEQPLGVMLLGEPLVLFRDADGAARCLVDRCAHSSAPLSLGVVCAGRLRCRYHGWEFDGGGRCRKIPNLEPGARIPAAGVVDTRPAVERHGMVWVYVGEPAAADPTAIPALPEYVDPAWWICVDSTLEADIDPALMIENLIDPSHLCFLHEGTIGEASEAQPLRAETRTTPEGSLFARFTSTREPPMRVLGPGFHFDPPCHVRVEREDLSFRRVFHVLPVAPGRLKMLWWIGFRRDALDRRTRLQLRVPALRRRLESEWLRKQSRIFSQDLPVLLATQRRLDEGGRAFALPVRGDHIALRYRRWREANDSPSSWFGGWRGQARPEPSDAPAIRRGEDR